MKKVSYVLGSVMLKLIYECYVYNDCLMHQTRKTAQLFRDMKMTYLYILVIYESRWTNKGNKYLTNKNVNFFRGEMITTIQKSSYNDDTTSQNISSTPETNQRKNHNSRTQHQNF